MKCNGGCLDIAIASRQEAEQSHVRRGRLLQNRLDDGHIAGTDPSAHGLQILQLEGKGTSLYFSELIDAICQ